MKPMCSRTTRRPGGFCLKPNTLLRGIQLKLRGTPVLVDGVLMGNRQGAADIWVLLFDPKMAPAAKANIHRYIKQSLQRFIDGLRI